jgi:hypothetical protein
LTIAKNSENLLQKKNGYPTHFRYLERNRWKRVMQRNTEKGATFDLKYPKKTLISWKLGKKTI